MAAVSLVYAPLAPLVPLGAAVVFWVSSVVYKYQLMFVFVSKVESGGVSDYEPCLQSQLTDILMASAAVESRHQSSSLLVALDARPYDPK